MPGVGTGSTSLNKLADPLTKSIVVFKESTLTPPVPNAFVQLLTLKLHSAFLAQHRARDVKILTRFQ